MVNRRDRLKYRLTVNRYVPIVDRLTGAQIFGTVAKPRESHLCRLEGESEPSVALSVEKPRAELQSPRQAGSTWQSREETRAQGFSSSEALSFVVVVGFRVAKDSWMREWRGDCCRPRSVERVGSSRSIARRRFVGRSVSIVEHAVLRCVAFDRSVDMSAMGLLQMGPCSVCAFPHAPWSHLPSPPPSFSAKVGCGFPPILLPLSDSLLLRYLLRTCPSGLPRCLKFLKFLRLDWIADFLEVLPNLLHSALALPDGTGFSVDEVFLRWRLRPSLHSQPAVLVATLPWISLLASIADACWNRNRTEDELGWAIPFFQDKFGIPRQFGSW